MNGVSRGPLERPFLKSINLPNVRIIVIHWSI